MRKILAASAALMALTLSPQVSADDHGTHASLDQVLDHERRAEQADGRRRGAVAPLAQRCLVAATFPAGTVSGAPKIRAMEIIDELESEARGPYAGAVGYFSFSGDLDTCITIRTLVFSGDEYSFQAGAGIVADSVPRKEYQEVMAKSAILRRALEIAGEGL